MSSPQNISAVSTNNPQQYFNNFFTNFGTVSANQNDAIIGFFEKQTNGNKMAAQALASAVIYTSLSQGVNPMSVITKFSGMSQAELSAYLTVFLNLNRKGTSLLGINNQPIVNKYIKRSILA